MSIRDDGAGSISSVQQRMMPMSKQVGAANVPTEGGSLSVSSAVTLI